MQHSARTILSANSSPPGQVDATSDGAQTLSAGWSGSAWRQLRMPALLIVCGFFAMTIDVPFSQAVVKDRILAKLDHFLETVETFGHAFGVFLIVMAIGCCDVSKRWALPRILAGSLGAGLAANVIKMTIQRARPLHYFERIVPAHDGFAGNALHTFLGVFPGTRAGTVGQSCPSSHVAVAVGLCFGLSTLYPQGRRYFALLAALVALQRIAAGAHFLSDTLWGGAVGCLFAMLIFRRDLLGGLFDGLERNWMMKRDNEVTPAADRTVPQEALAFGTSAPGKGLSLHLEPEAAQPREYRWQCRVSPSETPVASISKLSVIVPVYNERENIAPLFEAVQYTLAALEIPFEILFVDDGSNDGTDAELQELACHAATVKVVTLQKNFGQTAALRAGIEHASGDVLVTLDGDMQNDPADIPMMLHKLCEGYDLVHGWRKNRQDRFLDRRFPSMIANWLISRVTGCRFHDLGCTLKVMRREVATELELYGDLHRFIPILASARGARCAEVVTQHHPRTRGVSKVNILRTPRVMIDLITVKFLTQYLASPMRMFGSLGLACLAMGMLGVLACAAIILGGAGTPTVATVLCGGACIATMGLQFIGLGLLGEILTRNYFASSSKAPYTVRALANFDDAPTVAEPMQSFAA